MSEASHFRAGVLALTQPLSAQGLRRRAELDEFDDSERRTLCGIVSGGRSVWTGRGAHLGVFDAVIFRRDPSGLAEALLLPNGLEIGSGG
jgi:hypothetical protein